jgi:hypothetical protein
MMQHVCGIWLFDSASLTCCSTVQWLPGCQFGPGVLCVKCTTVAATDLVSWHAAYLFLSVRQFALQQRISLPKQRQFASQ